MSGEEPKREPSIEVDSTPPAPNPAVKSKRVKKSKVQSIESVVSGKVTFRIDPSQEQLIVISKGPVVTFHTKPDNYELLTSVPWRDESQAVRHSYTAATGRGSGRAALQRIIASGNGEEDVAK